MNLLDITCRAKIKDIRAKMGLDKGSPIRLRPATFRRVPFNRLRHLRGKTGTVRRVIGREERRALLEVEIVGVIGVCWDFEVREVREC